MVWGVGLVGIRATWSVPAKTAMRIKGQIGQVRRGGGGGSLGEGSGYQEGEEGERRGYAKKSLHIGPAIEYGPTKGEGI